MKEIRVAPAGTRGCRSLGEALELARDLPAGPLRIALEPGVYREKARIERPGLVLEGEGPDRTILTFDDSAHRLLPDGRPMGTFNSYVLYVGAPGVRVSGVAIENAAGDGRLVGQAVAVFADEDGISFEGCRIVARQDSLCVGPIPRNPPPIATEVVHPVAGFGRPAPAVPFRQYYKECLIEGDVDFVFGSGIALFERCVIRSRARGSEETFVAAPSTPPGQEAGFVFLRCRLEGEGPEGSVYLGRPWRPDARAAFIDCRLGPHIAPSGWHDWDKPAARATARFAERGSVGPGARPESRAPWAARLGAEEAERLVRIARG